MRLQGLCCCFPFSFGGRCLSRACSYSESFRVFFFSLPVFLFGVLPVFFLRICLPFVGLRVKSRTQAGQLFVVPLGRPPVIPALPATTPRGSLEVWSMGWVLFQQFSCVGPPPESVDPSRLPSPSAWPAPFYGFFGSCV